MILVFYYVYNILQSFLCSNILHLLYSHIQVVLYLCPMSCITFSLKDPLYILPSCMYLIESSLTLWGLGHRNSVSRTCSALDIFQLKELSSREPMYTENWERVSTDMDFAKKFLTIIIKHCWSATSWPYV